MFTGLPDTGRIEPHWTDEPDRKPAQNVNMRTKPKHTDAKSRAYTSLNGPWVGRSSKIARTPNHH